MLGVAITVAGDFGLAGHVRQQVFERIWREADLYDPCRALVRSWLMTIVRNLAVDTVRVRRLDPLGSDDVERLVGTMTATPVQRALAGELSMRLRAAFAELPPEQTRAAVLSGVHAMSVTQLADTEQNPVRTAKSRIQSELRTLHGNVPSAEAFR